MPGRPRITSRAQGSAAGLRSGQPPSFPEILWITASRYAQLSSRVAMAKIVVTVQKMTGEETVIEVDPQETAQTGMGSWR